jgi:hypothetical protein
MICKCALCGFSRDLPDDVRDWPSTVEGAPGIYPVTSTGAASSRLVGHICAKCLHSGNRMRGHVKALYADVHVTKHALERFDERNPGDAMNDESKVVAIIKIFQKAKKIKYRDHFMLQRLRSNVNTPAEYWFNAGWFFVTTIEQPKTIVTVERSFGRKVNKDFWFVKE